MNGIEVGKDAVCVNAKGVEYTGLKEGEIYRVRAIRQSCCGIEVDVGLPCNNAHPGLIRCSDCKIWSQNDFVEWKNINRFAPLMDISELESILKQHEQATT